jgi:peptidoglycan/LPS O-acetylase OafA/YrhL
VTPALRLIIQSSFTTLSIHHCTLTRVDTIAVGCCLAFLAATPSARRKLQLAGRPALLAGAGMVCVLLASQFVALKLPAYGLIVHPPLSALCFAGIVWVAIHHSAGPIGRFLNAKPLVALGVLSYSIYLWQQPFLNPHRSSWVCQWPVNIGLIALCAVASYLLIESPFLRLKERLRCR